MRRLICLFMVIGFFVSGCGTPATPIPFTRLADRSDEHADLEDDFYKGTPTTVDILIATNPVEQENLLTSIPHAFKPAIATVDMASTLILGAFLRVRGTSGYSVSIHDVRLGDDELIISVDYVTPKPNQLLSPGGPYPSFSVVGIDRALLPAGQMLTIRVIDQHEDELTTIQYQMP